MEEKMKEEEEEKKGEKKEEEEENEEEDEVDKNKDLSLESATDLVYSNQVNTDNPSNLFILTASILVLKLAPLWF